MENLKINYIIATWSGKRVKKVDEVYYENVLKKHIEKLSKTKHNLTQITVMRPQNDIRNSYYDFETLPNMVIEECPNEYFSYGQWVRAANKYVDDFDYFIFIEDDYVPDCDNFDHKLIELYVEDTYLCSKAAKLTSKIHHCAISNGIISSKTYKKVIEKQSMPEWFAKFKERDFQIGFSKYLVDNGVSLVDYSDNYMVTFHEQNFQIKDYSGENVKNNYEIFMPIQKLNEKSEMIGQFKFIKMLEGDMPFLIDIRNKYAAEFLHNSNTFNLNEAIEWFRKTNPDYWVIYVENTPIGYFRVSNHNTQNKNIMIGADIHPLFTGRGYGYKAYNEFIPFLFNTYDLHKISLEVLATNQRAINLYNKLGFVREGIKREDVLKGDKWVDSIIMSIIKEEYYVN